MMTWMFPLLKPKKLAEVTEQILHEVPDAPLDLITERIENTADFEFLLEMIRKTPPEGVIELAQNLTVAEVDTLSFRFCEVPRDLRRNTIAIIQERWKPRYAEIAWRQFQYHFRDQDVARFVVMGLEKTEVPGFGDNEAAHMIRLISSGEPAEQIAGLLASREQPFRTSLDKLRITENSPLGVELLKNYLLKASSKTYLELEDQEFIQYALGLMNAEYQPDYLKAVNRYLSTVPQSNYQEYVMLHIYRSLGHPDDSFSRVHGLDPENLERFRRWLNFRIMSEFFEAAGYSDRFQFWKQFADDLHKVRCITVKDYNVAFLVFRDIAVVEFAQVGNAAYVYPRDYYESQLEHYATEKETVTNKSQLKDPYNSLTRIIHHGNWQSRWYYTIAWLLKGGARR
ncbi:MAG TPA: hypothetical protein GX729_05235 [Firmicutes bacterium]|jgi:hypothetical protein|nr:hypothetical protein [Bacillota bacterium]